MKKFLPNLSPLTFSGSAVIVGYLLIDDFTPIQLAAISSWFSLVSSVLASNAAWQEVMNEKTEFCNELNKDQNDSSSDQQKDTQPSNENENSKDDQLELVLKSLKKIQEDLSQLYDSQKKDTNPTKS